MDPRVFRELVSGQRQGLWADAARAGLRMLEGPYALGAAWRGWRYDSGRADVNHVPVPVISVGNLTVGGTGKTPMVAWLAKMLLNAGRRVAVLSRGYGASPNQPNDEALMLAQVVPEAVHLQDPDRSAAARQAVAGGADVLVLDDGFQHRRLARDLDIVLLDGLAPFGHDHLLPRGLLRESVRGLRRAAAIVVTRSDLLDATARHSLCQRIAQLAPQAVLAWARHQPTSWRRRNGEVLSTGHFAV